MITGFVLLGLSLLVFCGAIYLKRKDDIGEEGMAIIFLIAICLGISAVGKLDDAEKLRPTEQLKETVRFEEVVR